MPEDLRNDPFVDYYAKQSESREHIDRSRRVKSLMIRFRTLGGNTVDNLQVADIGCNAGTQSLIWARGGHTVHGIDINSKLLEIARQRFDGLAFDANFVVGSATALPWPDLSMDVCLLPELLEHVAEWETCLREAARILKPNGVLYVSTTNKLCPRQMEYDLPIYSWYPGFLKRRFVQLAVTSRPELVNHALYPAVNWFTPYGLKRSLRDLGLDAFDHFEMIDESKKSAPARVAIWAIRHSAIVKFAAHVATSYSMIVARKR